jgi:hypothetical protein
LNVAQGSAAVHGLESLPVLEMQLTFPADSGAPWKNAVRATMTAKSFAMILIMFCPYDVTSGGGDIILKQSQKTDNGPARSFAV